MQGGLINKDEFDKLTVYGGKAQATKGIDGETAGNFIGSLPGLFGTKDQKADDVARRGIGIMNILQSGGSSAASGVAQFQGISSLAKTGSFASPEELAATQAFFSLSKKDAAGTLTESFQRSTTGALDRTRRAGIEGGEAQGEYLDKIGAKVGMTSRQVAQKIADDVAVQRKADKNFNLDNYLGKHGYGNQDDRFVMGNAIAGIESGQFGTFMEMADPKKIPTIEAAMKPIDESIKVDPTARARKSELAKDSADASRAVGAPERLLNARKVAFYKLQSEKKIPAGTFESYNDSNIYSGVIQDEVFREINERAKRANVDMTEYGNYDVSAVDPISMGANFFLGSGVKTGVLGGAPIDRLLTSDDTRAKAYEKLDMEIGQKTGEVISVQPIVDAMEKNTTQAKRVEDAILKGQLQNQVQPAKAPVLIDAQPPGGMQRPNGG